MKSVELLVIGAGLAGLSTAYHYQGKSLVLEAESEPGGKCRSITTESGATFDFTGHLLHLRKPEMIKVIDSLLPGKFQKIARQAAIFAEGKFLHYPFQANFYPLKPETVKECLLGFVKAWKKGRSEQMPDSFMEWALETFGDGICRHFIFPYNEKLYRTPVEQMSADWVGWSIPQPDIEAVIDGALGLVQEGMGYNAHFNYPKEGGIDILPQTLAAAAGEIIYDTRVVEIHPDKKVAVSSDGEEFEYEKLVSTIPLPELLAALVTGEKSRCQQWQKNLRWVNVHNINFTLDHKPEWPWHWLYLAEETYRCYRVGVSSNISSNLAPEGCSTLYTEVSYLPDEKLDASKTRLEVIDDLKGIGILEHENEIVEDSLVEIDYAYVVHDKYRYQHLPEIMAWLEGHGVVSTGRWGAWEYGGMEDALWQGYQVAEDLKK